MFSNSSNVYVLVVIYLFRNPAWGPLLSEPGWGERVVSAKGKGWTIGENDTNNESGQKPPVGYKTRQN